MARQFFARADRICDWPCSRARKSHFDRYPWGLCQFQSIRPGVIAVSLSDNRTVRLFVKGGFAEVDQNRLTVLAQRALEVEAMDAALIAAELKTAEGELAAATEDAARFAAHSAVDQLRTLQPRAVSA